MMNFKNKRICAFALMFFAAVLCFPRAGYSENKKSGYYAGPLSITAETVAEKTARELEEAENAKAVEALKQNTPAEVKEK